MARQKSPSDRSRKGGRLGKASGHVADVRKAPRPKLCCLLPGFVAGHLVHVYLSDERSCPKLEGCHGVTTENNGAVEIHIHKSLKRDVRLVTLMHELLHASVWLQSGKISKSEERWCEDFAPGLIAGFDALLIDGGIDSLASLFGDEFT